VFGVGLVAVLYCMFGWVEVVCREGHVGRSLTECRALSVLPRSVASWFESSGEEVSVLCRCSGPFFQEKALVTRWGDEGGVRGGAT